jgi:hypothetical protein
VIERDKEERRKRRKREKERKKSTRICREIKRGTKKMNE